MPTLFRLIFVITIIIATGYGALFAVANLVAPKPRMIVQAIALPQGASNVNTGRSVAETLNRQASVLVRHRKHASH